MSFRILVSDSIALDGIAVLEESAEEVAIRTGMMPAELVETVPSYDALIVRSESKVTREVLEAGRNLKVVGRAGFGVDVSRGTLGKGRGHILIVENEDRPGRVGAVGTALEGMDINIPHMAVGRRDPNESIMVLSIHRGLEPEELNEVGFIPGVVKVVQVRI